MRLTRLLTRIDSRRVGVTEILFFLFVAAPQEETGSWEGRCQTPPLRPQVCRNRVKLSFRLQAAKVKPPSMFRLSLFPPVDGSTARYQSFGVDVTGKPRSTKVRLPASVLGPAVRSGPNQAAFQFLSVEELARRRCRAGSLGRTQVAFRTFQLAPPTVDFGTLPEGSSASVMVRMTNVGVDLCRCEQQFQVICGPRPQDLLTRTCLCSGRFHVKQPPLKTGLRALYSPGPVGFHTSAGLCPAALCLHV